MGISGSGRASLERQLYLEKSRIQASSGNTALTGGQRTAKNYKYNLQVTAQMKYVVANRREILIITFLVIQMLSAFCTKGKGQICEICPRKGGTNLTCTNRHYRNRTYQCRLTLPAQGMPTALFSRAVIYYSNSTATAIPDSENKVFFVLVSLVTVPALTIFRKIADTFWLFKEPRISFLL